MMSQADFSFLILKKDRRTKARVGIIKTPHGRIRTPAFSPVATKASVKTLSPDDLKNAGSQVILANTYHLYLRPGIKILEKFGGFSPFMKWDGPTITDSGGYQVSFLWGKGKRDLGRVVKVSDEGAVFSSYIDGTQHLLTPEKSMQIQKYLGADIIMAFDQPIGSLHSDKQKLAAAKRTMLWEERSYIAWQNQEKKKKSGTYQALFGIIQGDTDRKMRQESLQFLLQFDFPGLAIGGQSIGSDPKLTARALETVIDFLPEDKPLHALGLGGGPEGIFEGVEHGVDLFDNTSVTRMARSGLLFIYPEDGGRRKNKFRINIKKKIYGSSKKPISRVCQCEACINYSSAYIHHLVTSQEILGLRLASLHNITFINSLMLLLRKNIKDGRFQSLKKVWIS